MKKLVSILTAVLLLVTFAACSSGSSTQSQTTAPAQASSTQTSEQTKPAEEKKPFVFDRAIEWICCFGAGSGNDGALRALAPEVSKILGVPVNVTNVSGGSGAVGFEHYMSAPADGYTYLNCSPSHIIRSLAGDISGDITDPETFRGVCIISSGAYCIQGAAGKFTDINELVAFAKANPGTLRIGGIGNLGLDYVAASQFREGFGIDCVYVAFDADTEITTALLTGDVDLGISSPGDTAEYVEAGTTNCYVVFGSDRNPVLPDVPCTDELNVSCNFITARYLMSRTDIPEGALEAMRAACDEAAKSESFKAYLELNGIFTDTEGYHNGDYLDNYLQTMKVFMKEIGF